MQNLNLDVENIIPENIVKTGIRILTVFLLGMILIMDFLITGNHMGKLIGLI